MPNEKTIERNILRWLNRQDGVYAEKVHGSPYGGAGKPDIDCCWRGRAVKLEVKQPGKEPTELQQYELDKWNAAGAISGCVRSVDEVKDLLAGNGIFESDWEE